MLTAYSEYKKDERDVALPAGQGDRRTHRWSSNVQPGRAEAFPRNTGGQPQMSSVPTPVYNFFSIFFMIIFLRQGARGGSCFCFLFFVFNPSTWVRKQEP